jgi:hypothetical protein
VHAYGDENQNTSPAYFAFLPYILSSCFHWTRKIFDKG